MEPLCAIAPFKGRQLFGKVWPENLQEPRCQSIAIHNHTPTISDLRVPLLTTLFSAMVFQDGGEALDIRQPNNFGTILLIQHIVNYACKAPSVGLAGQVDLAHLHTRLLQSRISADETRCGPRLAGAIRIIFSPECLQRTPVHRKEPSGLQGLPGKIHSYRSFSCFLLSFSRSLFRRFFPGFPPPRWNGLLLPCFLLRFLCRCFFAGPLLLRWNGLLLAKCFFCG
mmetsp:Transcript_128141/g.232978  ORF Transcript_128141/g.232978 Transcript_128141/m.232978 type:complete len:225 (-) Transcript_128141:229-903(-)